MNSPIRIVALALHFSILVYGGAVIFMAKANGWTPSWALAPDKLILLYIFLGIALICGGLSVMWPRILMLGRPTLLFYDFSQTTPAIQTVTIVRMALAESIAVFGMVLSFITQSPMWVISFGLVGLTLQIIVGPFGQMLRNSR